MKNRLILLALCILCFVNTNAQVAAAIEKTTIANLLDNWHKAAAEVKFDAYFGALSKDAVYAGTDPSEHWQLDAFKAFSKPYFDRGKAWNFKAVERHIYLSDDLNFAWFDELLDTQMKLCRGSGVLQKENGKWKIVHYVLSISIPNDKSDEVVKIKKEFDERYLQTLKSKISK